MTKVIILSWVLLILTKDYNIFRDKKTNKKEATKK